MKCTECNGVGLVDKTENGVVFAQEICPTCKGVGHDGTEPVSQEKKVEKKVEHKKK